MTLLLLALIYLAFISLGLPDSLLGSGWPSMHEMLSVPISYMGIVSMLISGGTILSSLLSDKMTRKFGTHAVTVVSVFLTAVALLGFSISNHFWMLLFFAIPYGLGAGAIDAALNNYVALHYTSSQMSWLHCFWGVGAIVSPFVMSYALTHANWQAGYRIVGLLQLVIAVILLFSAPVWSIHKQSVSEGTKSIGLYQALKIKGVPFLLLGFFAYCAAEATCMGWASTYMVEVKHQSPEFSASLASLFYIGITAGRFLSGFVSNHLGDRKMIRLGTCILSGGIVLLLISSPVTAFAGFVIIGFGCAPIYPSIIHSAPFLFGEENSGAIIGIQMASAYVGSTFMPPLYGFLGSLLGFRILPIYLLLFFALMIIMTEASFRVAANTQRGMTRA